MKTIKRFSHIALEQKRLAKRRAALEEDIRKDWAGIRHTFEPANFAKGAFFSGLSWVGERLFSTERRSQRNHSHSS